MMRDIEPSRLFYVFKSVFITLCLLVPFDGYAGACNKPKSLGPAPERLVVIVPATSHGSGEWVSFLGALKQDPASRNVAYFVYEHNISYLTLGHARNVGRDLSSCIDEKLKAGNYKSVTVIGHSVGGMLARYAYLFSAGALPGETPPVGSWSGITDRILLFASVNKGIRPDITWWSSSANWLLRTLPHPRFILEDLALGSDFIADVRIAWIRHFGALNNNDSPLIKAPQVVQFWGTQDSIVTENDNSDIEAFSGPVIERISGAKHGDLHRLEAKYTDDADSRWNLFRRYIFEDTPPRQPVPAYEPRRVLIIARGIRTSSNSEWVNTLREEAGSYYGEGNIETIEYGYFSAAHFAMKPLRARNIPEFRDIYAQRLAENPLTEFDFIGHSNGTYILGHSLATTPSMRFRNVVLAAPVLPTDFDWKKRFQLQQVKNVRYDTARFDWPVGILCQALRAVGFSDVGPSGVSLFGEGAMSDSRIKNVGWYEGDHSAALRVDPGAGVNNLHYLLEFAVTGKELGAGESLSPEVGFMLHASRATPYLIWGIIALLLFFSFRHIRSTKKVPFKAAVYTLVVLFSVYALLDII